MKEDAGNEYQGKDVVVDVNVVATQVSAEEDAFDNTYDVGAEFPIIVANPNNVTEALSNAAPGTTVVLEKVTESYGTINLPANLAKNITIKGQNGVEVEKLVLAENAQIDNLELNSISFKTTNDSNKMLELLNNNSVDIVFNDCVFEGTGVSTNTAKDQCVVKSNNVSSTEYSIQFDNCTFINVGRAIYPNDGHCIFLIVKNCKFSGGGAWTIIGNNNTKGLDSVVIDNCIFDNVCGVAKFSDKAKNVTITNNIFIGNCKQDRNLSKKEFDITSTVTKTLSGNKAGNTLDTVVDVDISKDWGIK